MKTTNLCTLLDRVEQGEGADREIDAAIGDYFGTPHKERNRYRRGHYIAGKPVLVRVERIFPSYASAIDAAVSLVEKVLPGWDHGYESGDCIAFGKVWSQGRHDDTVVRGEARTPARAILAATLRAKIAQEVRT